MIVGVMGLIGAGKDTVSDIFVREHGFEKISFADSVKDVVSTVFDWDREMMEGATPESREFRDAVDQDWSDMLGVEMFSPRKAMQMVGTDTFRNHFNNNIWVYNTMRRASKYENTVISDVRFVNEANAILDAGGVLIRVFGSKTPSWYDVAQMAAEGDEISEMYMESHYPHVHRSEWDCAAVEANYVIENTGTKDDLNSVVLEVHESVEAVRQ